MAKFYSARSKTISPLPWLTFALPFSKSLWREGRGLFWMGAAHLFAAYAIVTWAFTQVPIALVTALRETSIIFALLIGVFFLKERLDLMKVLSTMTVLIKAALLRLARP